MKLDLSAGVDVEIKSPALMKNKPFQRPSMFS